MCVCAFIENMSDHIHVILGVFFYNKFSWKKYVLIRGIGLIRLIVSKGILGEHRISGLYNSWRVYICMEILR